ncbi:hypothetical protein GCM10010377_01690 [Streptomyces viridiviolaceus]|nr:hypothetical protein GCM10010377_01690 [Streptomyces viridiviolaceus]
MRPRSGAFTDERHAFRRNGVRPEGRQGADGTENAVPRSHPAPYTRLATARRPAQRRIEPTSEGSPTVRHRTAVAAPRSRYTVILVSSSVRYPLRGRYRMSVTPA